MTFARSILALLISVGLVLSPIAAALPAKAPETLSATTVDDCPSHAKTTAYGKLKALTGDHACCAGMVAACASALCALKCFKVVAMLDRPAPRPSVARQFIAPDVTTQGASFGWRPPTPPPRA